MNINDAAKIISTALSLLPSRYNTPQARAMILAIAMQESALRHRAQVPSRIARGYWQFEPIGVRGVLTHPQTDMLAREVVTRLDYPAHADAVYHAIEHNDVLACCIARLALVPYPGALPGPDDVDEGWKQYIRCWRPGKPKPDTWPGYYERAWAYVGKD